MPNSLKELWCTNKKIISLEGLPYSLQKIYCNNNQILSLPTSLLNCTQLRCIDYTWNPIENIHPLITRFLNRMTNINMSFE